MKEAMFVIFALMFMYVCYRLYVESKIKYTSKTKEFDCFWTHYDRKFVLKDLINKIGEHNVVSIIFIGKNITYEWDMEENVDLTEYDSVNITYRVDELGT